MYGLMGSMMGSMNPDILRALLELQGQQQQPAQNTRYRFVDQVNPYQMPAGWSPPQGFQSMTQSPSMGQQDPLRQLMAPQSIGSSYGWTF